MNPWHEPSVLITLGALIFCVTVFVVGALLWLKRLRQTMARTVEEALKKQHDQTKTVEDVLMLLHQNQKQIQAHVASLTQVQNRVRQDMLLLSTRVDRRDMGTGPQTTVARVLH